MGAYDDAARAYLDAGWSPIPVMGKTMPAKGTTGYEGTVTAEKVQAWLQDDLTARAIAKRGVGVDNIGLRHQLTLAIDVDQGYGDKDGVSQLATWAAKLRLPPLPATWSSTARGDDSPSRQYLYGVPEDVTLKTKPCPSVELCCWHHRFTVCAPTIHPGTGTPYTWYEPGAAGVPPTWGAPSAHFPTPGQLAPLPPEWFLALRGGVANADRNATVVALPALIASFPEGEPDGLVRYLITKWSDEAEHVGHDEAKNALINCFMVGREGHPGVAELYRVLIERYTAYLDVARPAAAATEVRSLVAACATIAQQKPVNLTVKGFSDIVDSAPGTWGRPTVAEFMAGVTPRIDQVAIPHPASTPSFAAAATDEELDTFLGTYTRYLDPARLGRRTAWMRADPGHRLGYHARAIVADVMAGYYPADRAVRALGDAHRHHGGRDPRAARQMLAVALGAVLDRRIGASA